MQNRFTKQVQENRFIDKTHLIEEIIYDGAKIKNFVLPKGFGKSMSLDMLNSFFSNTLNHGDYFDGLYIAESRGVYDVYEEHQGKYPVIYLNLAALCSQSLEESLQKFKEAVVEIYQQHKNLLLSHYENNNYEKKYISSVLNGSASIYNLIQKLTQYLTEIYKKEVIILIDDYDLPLNKAREHFYANELIMYFFDIFTMVFKSNEFLHMAVLMGKESFPYESVYSGLNNIMVYHYDDYRYSDCFGFDVEEVTDEITRLKGENIFSIAEVMDKLRLYYGGYYAKDTELLNSQCVDQFITGLEQNKVNFALDLFDDTASIHTTLQRAKNSEILLSAFNSLAEDKAIITTMYDQANYQRYKDKNHAYFWGHMVNCGYLTYTKNDEDDYGDTPVMLQVPNFLAKQFFVRLQSLVIEQTAFTKLELQHETKNLKQSCLNLFSFLNNTSDLQRQDKELYHHLLHQIQTKQLDAMYLQKITNTMDEFCKLSVFDRKEKRIQLRKFLVILEDQSNKNIIRPQQMEKV